MWNVLSVNAGTAASSGLPGFGERPGVGLPPLRARQRRFAQCQAINRTDQAHAALHRAVIQHQARRRRLDGGATRLRVDEQARVRAGGGCEIERLGEGHGPAAVAAAHREQLRLRSARRMRVERAPRDHGQALRPDRLDADVVNARRDRALDLGREQAFEHLEEPVLQRDRQRQQPVQKGRDRRQILAQRPVAIGQLEPVAASNCCSEQPSTLPAKSTA